MWGSNARDAHPIFFHHVLAGVRNGAKLYVVDPRRTSTAQFADLWLGLHVGTDIALSNTIAREIIAAGLVNTAFVERGTTGFAEYAASVEEWTLERGVGGHRHPGRGDPRAGPRLRPRRPRPAVLDARHHRAPQRRRQRARPHQPGAAVRSRRSLGLRPQPAARPEQRAGRRRHGRAAEQAARLPGRRGRRRAGEVRRRMGRRRPTAQRLAPHATCSRRCAAASCGRCT